MGMYTWNSEKFGHSRKSQVILVSLDIMIRTPPSLEKVVILTYRAWGGGGEGIIQEQDGDADCTFIQRGQVPTFKGANVHPLI